MQQWFIRNTAANEIVKLYNHNDWCHYFNITALQNCMWPDAITFKEPYYINTKYHGTLKQ
jgi:hypothetical protein